MTVALKPPHHYQHGYRLSDYERRDNELLPGPIGPAISLAAGAAAGVIDLPRVALDPCGGDGALRRCLALFGADVRLIDLYPEMYLPTDGYLNGQALASDVEHLRLAVELDGWR
jgi:hypothetical protein